MYIYFFLYPLLYMRIGKSFFNILNYKKNCEKISRIEFNNNWLLSIYSMITMIITKLDGYGAGTGSYLYCIAYFLIKILYKRMLSKNFFYGKVRSINP